MPDAASDGISQVRRRVLLRSRRLTRGTRTASGNALIGPPRGRALVRNPADHSSRPDPHSRRGGRLRSVRPGRLDHVR